jgi:hypothetical protein
MLEPTFQQLQQLSKLYFQLLLQQQQLRSAPTLLLPMLLGRLVLQQQLLLLLLCARAFGTALRSCKEGLGSSGLETGLLHSCCCCNGG